MNVAVCDVAPSLPVTVNAYCPGAADAVVETERIDLNLGLPEVGLSDAETPAGAPETVRETLLDVPDRRPTLTVEVVLAPGVMVCWSGEIDIEKSKDCAVFTVSRAFA